MQHYSGLLDIATKHTYIYISCGHHIVLYCSKMYNTEICVLINTEHAATILILLKAGIQRTRKVCTA
jgi:hypothetical protein